MIMRQWKEKRFEETHLEMERILKWMETNLVAMNWGARREGTILIPQAERRSR